MIIEHITGFNWGRHETIDFTCDGGVVGVVGSNGSGKSTVLDLVEFLITGETRDALDSYVRIGQKNGGGQMTFHKNGQRGTIFRQVGSTSKRKLTWGDHEYTKAAEVEGKMREIFGSDKKALANSVFVNQGTMENVLFKTEGRRKAFIRLVNLAFCETNSRAVMGHIERISATVVDLTPARDEAFAARRDTLAAHDALCDQLAVLPDQSVQLRYLQSMNAARMEVTLLERQIGEEQVQLATKEAELAGVMPAGVDLQQYYQQLTELTERITTTKQTYTTYSNTFTELSHYRRIVDECAEHSQRNTQILSRLKALNPAQKKSEQLQAEIKNIKDLLQQLDRYDQIVTKLDELHLELTTRRNALEALGQPPDTSEDLDLLRQDISNKDAQLKQLSKWLGLQLAIARKVQDKVETEPTECPECGLTLLNLYALDQSNLQELSSQVDVLRQEIPQLQSSLKQRQTALTNYNQQYNQATGGITTVEAHIRTQTEAMHQAFVPAERAQLEADKLRLETDQNERSSLNDELRTSMQMLTQKKESLKHYPLAAANWDNREEFTPLRNNELFQVVQALEAEYTRNNQTYNLAYGIFNTVGQIREQVDRKLQRLEELGQEMSSAAPEGYAELLAQCEGNLTKLEAVLVGGETTRNNLGIQVGNALANYTAANVRFQDLEQRIEKDKSKLELVKDLRRLRDLLSDDGLPMMFVQRKFEVLARYTQEALVKMNADFFITINRDAELEFRFTRLDGSGSDLEMVKMSGGQRVRTCVAFLMALQRTLIKDVGLLVLDEPTVHVDSKGVDQMIEFFCNMRQELKNADHQIWIVDHDPKMRAALECCLQLN